MKWFSFFMLFVMVSASSCQSERATPEQCRIIFNRLLALELAEMGFNDPALEERRQVDFAYRYRKQIVSCAGRKIPPGALKCVRSAKSSESVSHDCLR
ncbi:MAG: hypothetical protein CMH56_02630 [Myxococcales bacterium]|nr:hypothetical protein [Myxococcales bacterium]|tara:strand:+ start:1486 stop:1779 length:294 start_codon:yes stop_codon:yes gene_type:complete